MGVGGSQPALRAEVRLELPETACSAGSAFFARLHTAAEGQSKYKAWGKAQQVGLYPDDIITVSIHAAKSEAHFDTQCCEDIAELFLPWELIETCLATGEEAVFNLGFNRGAPSRNSFAHPTFGEFRDSFLRAQQLAKDSKTSRLVVGVRRMPDVGVFGSSEDVLQAERAVAQVRQQASAGRRPSADARRPSDDQPLPGPGLDAGRPLPSGSLPSSSTSVGNVLLSGTPIASATTASSTPPPTPSKPPLVAVKVNAPSTKMPLVAKPSAATPLRSLSPGPPSTSQSLMSRGGASTSPAISSGQVPGTSPSLKMGHSKSMVASPLRGYAVERAVSSPQEGSASLSRGTAAKVVPRGGVPTRLQASPVRGASPPRGPSPNRGTPLQAVTRSGAVSPPPALVPLGFKGQRLSAEVPGARSPAASPPTPLQPSFAVHGVEEPRPEDVLFLRQAQVHNQRLRQQLGLRDDETLAEAEEALDMHAKRLEQAVHQSFNLRAKLQNADKELAMLGASISSLSKEERLALTSGSLYTGGAASPPPSGNVVEDYFSAEVKRQSDKVLAEIQDVTRSNLDMIKEQDEQIKTLEKDVSLHRRQYQKLTGEVNSRTSPSNKHNAKDQLQSIETEIRDVLSTCQDIEAALNQEQIKKSESVSRTIQKLQTERDVFLEEIDKLRQTLENKDQLQDSEYVRPATAVLVDEAGQLKEQLSQADDRGVLEQGALELQAEDLKTTTKEHQKQLQAALAEKEAMEAELQELRENRDGAKAIERECHELRERKEALANEAGRFRQRIRAYDEKIGEQRNETEDMRRRVKDVVGAR